MFTAFAVDNIQAEYERFRQRGVVFRSKPMPMWDLAAVFDDTCGNLTHICQID